MSGNVAPPELERAVMNRNGRAEGAEIRFRCPHPDRHRNGDATPSARYHPERQVWHCDACGAGGGWVELCQLLDVDLPRRESPGRPQIVARYEYRDEEGGLLRRKLRWEPGFQQRPKSFTWEKPDGQGGWTSCKGDGNPGVLYRSEALPVARESGSRVWAVEGEKDVDTATTLGVVAVCNPEGAGKGKWKDAYSAQLEGLQVAVIADRDARGRAHAASVAKALAGRARSVKIIELPGDGVKDLSDWVLSQKNRGLEPAAIAQELEALLDSAPLAEVTTQSTPDALTAALQTLEGLSDKPDVTEFEAPLRTIASCLPGLDELGRELVHERVKQALDGKAKAPAQIIAPVFKDIASEPSEGLQGHAPMLSDPEPYGEPVDGAELLSDLEATFLRFVVLPEGAAPAASLWTVFSHAHRAFYISPLLALISPVKRCGKTTMLSVLDAVVRRPLPASNITPAALFRAVERYEPTLLIDEADSFLRDRDELRGILNSGHTRSTAYVVRTAGDNHEARTFSTWAPKVIALIGTLRSTLEDRSIPFPMKRKAPGEKVERLRLDRLGELEDLRRRALRWALDHEQELREADPEVPPGLHDRAADNWRPLLAIADAAGGNWPEKAREAARQLSIQNDDGDSSIGVQLLSDIKEIFEARDVDRLFSEPLLADLVSHEDRPWGEWRNGKPLTAIGLAHLLKPFGISPKKIRIGAATRQGYCLEDLADALLRYPLRAPRP